MNHRIFERTLRSLVFRGARLFECRETLKLDALVSSAWLLDSAVSLSGTAGLKCISWLLLWELVLLSVIIYDR